MISGYERGSRSGVVKQGTKTRKASFSCGVLDGCQNPSELHQHIPAKCHARLSESEGQENSGESSFNLPEVLKSLLLFHQLTLGVENRFHAKEMKQHRRVYDTMTITEVLK